jgi:DNA adenine methylase
MSEQCTQPWRTAGEVLRRWDTPEQPARNHVFHHHTTEIIERIRKTAPGDGVFNYRQTWVRLHADRPAPTVTGAHGGVFVHPWRDRCLSPRELANLQDFPNEYLFYGSKSSIWQQIGNAVPVGLARAVGKACLEMLRQSTPPLPHQSVYRLPYVLKSPLRFPGGKSRAIQQILRFLPGQPAILVSPFLGGASAELAAAAIGWEVVGYDANTSLVEWWQVLLEDPKTLADAVEKYHPLSREHFYELQQATFGSKLERAAQFYVLNRASFSGLTRSGGMSPGHCRFTMSSIRRLRAFGVQNLSVRHADFRVSIPAHPDALLLVDPPYMTASRLYGNRGDLHASFDHQSLHDLLVGRERWVLCYDDCPLTRTMYEGHTIVPVHWKYGMCREKNSREIVVLSHDLAELHQDRFPWN